ncbi:acylneuraminate cytidylyltransferase family protein [Bacteroides sp.]
MSYKRRILAVIPARGGSKGLPGKNIKELAGKPLICYTIDAARQILDDTDICVSTDDEKIKRCVESYGLKVPFLRPFHLAMDNSSSVDVLLHALQFYAELGKVYDTLLLLQPTSPFRTGEHISGALDLYDDKIDMIVSVKESHTPSCLCSENQEGYLRLLLNGKALRRQELPTYYEYNGAIYIINIKSLEASGNLSFSKTKKYLMDDIASVDIDNLIDFQFAEFLVTNHWLHIRS